MKLLKTKINGPKIIKTTIFKDSRGFLKENYKKNIINNIEFPFDVMSYSKRNVNVKKECTKRFAYTNCETSSQDNHCYPRKNI